MSQDCAIALQPGNRVTLHLKNKNKKEGEEASHVTGWGKHVPGKELRPGSLAVPRPRDGCVLGTLKEQQAGCVAAWSSRGV